MDAPLAHGLWPELPSPPDISYIRRKWLDLPYAGLSPAQALDIYLPNEGDGPFPVIFYIHGGGFAIGDKRDGMVSPSLAGLERGYAVVSVNYRLSDEAIFPAGVQDVKAALRWVKAHAADYSLDALTYVSDAMAPILLQHGTADCLVPYQQSVELARVIEERVGSERYELELLEGASHGDPLFETPENVTRVFDFMDRYVGRPTA